MINLRYHIVSLVAVFLALSIGLIIGSTVIQEALVDNLRDNVESAEKRVTEAEVRNDSLQAELDDSNGIDAELRQQGPPQLLRGRLLGVPVLLASVEGVDDGARNDLRTAVEASGAEVAGVVRFEGALAFENETDVTAAQELLGSTATDPEQLRQELAERLAQLVRGANEGVPPPLTDFDDDLPEPEDGPVGAAAEDERRAALALTSFLRDLDGAGLATVAALPDDVDVTSLTDLRFVLQGGAGAAVDDASFTVPLMGLLADPGEPLATGVEAKGGDDQERGVFVGPLRERSATRNGTSTVDDLDAFAGLAATVLAVEQQRGGRVGHYGVAAGADRLLPERATTQGA